MPANNVITPLLGGKYYHIFNRGINRNSIFFEIRNYNYFLQLWKKYLNDSVDVLAYCLLPNHFHFLIRIKEEIEIQTKEGDYHLVKDDEAIGKLVSEQLRRLFISFSQAINRQENRTGSLLSRNFKRIEIEDDKYLKYLFFYIHFNPMKHGVESDFKAYKFSSYSTYTSEKYTQVAKEHGLELFDGLESFLNFHEYYHQEKENLNLE